MVSSSRNRKGIASNFLLRRFTNPDGLELVLPDHMVLLLEGGFPQVSSVDWQRDLMDWKGGELWFL